MWSKAIFKTRFLFSGILCLESFVTDDSAILSYPLIVNESGVQKNIERKQRKLDTQWLHSSSERQTKELTQLFQLKSLRNKEVSCHQTRKGSI